jgi:hypothetical protein
MSRDKWREANKEKSNLCKARCRIKRRLEMIKAYGGKCACCSEDTPQFLTLDHKNGGGNKDRNGRKSNHYIITRLRKEGWPGGNHQLLCWNCNSGRAINGGICPHREEIE